MEWVRHLTTKHLQGRLGTTTNSEACMRFDLRRLTRRNLSKAFFLK